MEFGLGLGYLHTWVHGGNPYSYDPSKDLDISLWTMFTSPITLHNIPTDEPELFVERVTEFIEKYRIVW